MSKNEVGHINESLKTKAIPTPKLLNKVHKYLQILEESEIVIVPTEKTNRFISMKKEKYKPW